jgi:hypothetical protein
MKNSELRLNGRYSATKAQLTNLWRRQLMVLPARPPVHDGINQRYAKRHRGFQESGNAILNSVIQALVEVGIQYLKNAAMAMIADKMTSNSSQQAGAQTAAAWAPAAAAASIATFGGCYAGIAGSSVRHRCRSGGKRKNGGPVTLVGRTSRRRKPA